MTPLELVLPFSGSIIAGFAAGICFFNYTRTRRTLDLVLEQTVVALDILESMEHAQDPGRDVHDRLAFALESRLIVATGPKVEPAERRVAAQYMAAQIIEDVRRANLELSAR